MLFPVLLALAAVSLPPGVDDPQLFPGAANRDPVEIQLAGLAALYPGRVLHRAPYGPIEGNLGRLPKVVDLPRNVTYLRAYNLDDKTRKQIGDLLAKQPLTAFIIDLRYVFADATDSENLAEVLAKAGLACGAMNGLGALATSPLVLPPLENDKPSLPLVLAMVNGQTSGPLEAWLEAFQEREGVLLVGTATAGQPGKYDNRVEGHPDYYLLTGELQPESGPITGTGLKPRFVVDVKPEQDYVAWSKVESGADISTMLRRDRVILAAAMAPTPAPAAGTAAPAPIAPASTTPTTVEETADLTLQRALDVVAAMQVLHPSLTAKVPANAKTAKLPQDGASTATPR